MKLYSTDSTFWNLATSSNLLGTALTVVAIWTSWYVWRFFLVPLRFPDEPRELPYLVPVIGHALSMMTGAHRLFTRGRKRFGTSPWTLTIMGESMYVIDSPEDILAVYKAPQALNYDAFIKVILGKYGISDETLSKMFDVSGSRVKNWMEASVDNFKVQLHPGEKLDALAKALLGRIDESLTWENINGRMVLQDGKKEKVVSLYDWAETVIVDAQTCTFFDKAIFQVCPDLLVQFQLYEDESWKLPLDLPHFATKALRSSAAYIEAGLIQYLELPEESRPKESWLIHTFRKDMQTLGLDRVQEARLLFSIFRVVNSNAYKLVFWIISYVLFDESLKRDLRSEIEPAFTTDTALNHQYLFESCPLLASTCEEALRLTNWSMGSRTVMTESVIGGRRLRAGRTLLMPYRALHFDTEIFGGDSSVFNPRRFMDRKTLVKSTSYRPFGGAVHYCPGRFIARREVQMFVAVILKRFEVSVKEKDGKMQVFPKMDDSLPSGGVQAPAKGEGLLLCVRPA